MSLTGMGTEAEREARMIKKKREFREEGEEEEEKEEGG